MKAMILTIGDEVISGKTLNTNQQFLSFELEKLGIQINRCVSVGDDIQTIQKVITFFMESQCDLLVTTGGLGPTHDDVTKEAIYAALEIQAVEHPLARKHLTTIFGKNIAKSNYKQAMFAPNSILLPNPLGSAMGSILLHQEKTIVCLVGPPFEMHPMFLQHVVPFLQGKTKQHFYTKEHFVVGLSESKIEDLLQEYYMTYKEVSTNPYAGNGIIRYLLKSTDEDVLIKASNTFQEILGEHVIENGSISLVSQIAATLNERHEHISVAESCTGGMLASMIVDEPGVSSIFEEGFITYSDAAKIKYLQVHQDTLEQFGAVSAQTVTEMLFGLHKNTQSDLCIAISGISGPDGGTTEKPVGTTVIGVSYHGKTEVVKVHLRGNRSMIRTRACFYALWRAYLMIQKS